MSRTRLVGMIARVVAVLATIAAVVFIVRRLDLRALGEALRMARPSWLLVATLLGLFRLVSRAAIWQVSLHVEPAVPSSGWFVTPWPRSPPRS